MVLLVLSVICICLSGCQPAQADYASYGNRASTTAPPAITSRPYNSVTTNGTALRDSLNEFAFQLYNKSLPPGGVRIKTNAFFSPISIFSALMLVYAGANGDTRNEVTTALNLQSQGIDILTSIPSLINLSRPSPIINGTVAYDLSLVARAYIDQTIDVSASYASLISTKLNSTVGSVDFINNAEGARSEINQWAAQQTNNKIPDLVPAVTSDSPLVVVNGSTRLLLVNAFSFQAAWANQFDGRLTEKAMFTDPEGIKTQVDMMVKSKVTLLYFNSSAGSNANLGLPAFQMVSIPYKANKLSLLLFLPQDVNGFPQLEAAFRLGFPLDAILKAARNETINLLNLPKFTLRLSLVTKRGSFAMRKTGIVKMFDEDQADLRGISAHKPLFVFEVVHQTLIEVNERGPEAAAVAPEVLVESVSSPIDPINFIADHAFLFAIRDTQTGLIIILGRVSLL